MTFVFLKRFTCCEQTCKKQQKVFLGAVDLLQCVCEPFQLIHKILCVTSPLGWSGMEKVHSFLDLKGLETSRKIMSFETILVISILPYYDISKLSWKIGDIISIRKDQDQDDNICKSPNIVRRRY